MTPWFPIWMTLTEINFVRNLVTIEASGYKGIPAVHGVGALPVRGWIKAVVGRARMAWDQLLGKWDFDGAMTPFGIVGRRNDGEEKGPLWLRRDMGEEGGDS
ncbi:hypothetical protein BDK51DRAFT_28239 [Blyttiomyces helicus]|uniref:Uncharacterized protein n=1 Tax=Blyttiomyces helicus TaxID=388810 RepID=A0A4P9WFW0_9FUNG|nr:hypothetical protein BDK51DRAFT_28239 [Blyttiomyces helicus]|eukprot:RKO90673.1 hypothetical protein BDK51DRAFT_28239 [Blyttiomyces helicus]